MAAPPSYQDAEAGASLAEQSPPSEKAFFGTLNLAQTPSQPESNTCLAHLRLLFAFQTLKEDVGYTDGLWGLWDTRAEGHKSVTKDGKVHEPVATDSKQEVPTDKHLLLSQIREKRWALFVARAVDRYEAWWSSLVEGSGLTEQDMNDPDSAAYARFPSRHNSQYWAQRSLPPLGKLPIYSCCHVPR